MPHDTFHRARRGSSGSLWMPPPPDVLPEPAPPPPERTAHGKRGCAHAVRGVHRPPAFKSPASGHDREVWGLLDWSCRNGIVSELEDGNMRVDLREPWRTRLIDSLVRLSSHYPACVQRVEATTFTMPCPRCGRGGYRAVVV